MKFNDKTAHLVADLRKSAVIISKAMSVDESLAYKLIMQGAFMTIAHCLERHDQKLPIDVDALLCDIIGEDGLRDAKMYCEDVGEDNLIKLLASPVEVRVDQAQ